MKVILPDNSERVFEGANAMDLAKSIGKKLAKAAVAAEVNGEIVQLTQPLAEGDRVRILTFDDEEGKEVVRHTASHVMAQAVLHVLRDKNVKFAIGPAIKNGFYYDFDLDSSITTEDFPAIEKEMKKIVEANYPIVRSTMPREKALAWAEEQKQPYKEELIRDLPEDAEISFYTQGDFTDLCAGPHLASTGRLRHFKLMSVAGAYWRGDEKRQMLQRVYATAFDDKKELDDYIFRMEEAKKRDHRKLGKELDLFSVQEEGPGFPFFHPKGMVLKNQLIDFWRKEHVKRGYEEISTPMILSSQLWKTSGHWDHYRENMYTVAIDDQEFAIKPMNCPGGMLMFKRKRYSYRDLPVRMAELGTVHRHELSGALHGLMRVRCFTQDDAHIFMTMDQITDEIIGVLDLTEYFYNVFGFKFHVEVSTRPEDSMGTDEQWETATNALIGALEKKGWPFTINEGDGAFYGPKIDVHLEDCIGRTWQCGTVQLDFQMPERFDLTYDGADGEKHRPVMIHRVVLGSIERFIGVLTEHFGGAFPLWLAPVQVKVMTITDRVDDFAQKAAQQLREAGLRVELDARNEKIGYKIRQARNERIPYMLVIGDREAEAGQVAVRKRGEGEMGDMALEDFLSMAQAQVESKEIF
ncbi:MAG: threonine--tRNA ligase [Clostridiales bacterium]|nr:threonine--tRNA ligase [Clostridiales bacterium]